MNTNYIYEIGSLYSKIPLVIDLYDLEDGKTAISLARAALDRHFGLEPPELSSPPKKFFKKSGVFVTLNRFPKKELRGCIGYVLPVMKLKTAIEENALNAALKDPRFQRLRKEELEKIVVEVSLLTVPEKIRFTLPEELTGQIKIGRDGLIVEKSFFKGLLLPQVPLEWEWDVEEFLSHTCMKAGLPPDTWRKERITVKRFSARVFAESSPRGEVKEKALE